MAQSYFKCRYFLQIFTGHLCMWLNIDYLILAAIVASLEIGVLVLQPCVVGWHCCKPQCSPTQCHTVALEILGFLAWQMLKLVLQQSPRLWFPKPHKLRESFAKSPFIMADSYHWLSRDFFKGLCAKAGQAATLRGFWDLIVVLFQK